MNRRSWALSLVALAAVGVAVVALVLGGTAAEPHPAGAVASTEVRPSSAATPTPSVGQTRTRHSGPRRTISVPPGYTGINDPRLQRCMREHRVCNPDATKGETDGPNGPIHTRLKPGEKILSRAAVVKVAHGDDLQYKAIYTALMTGQQAIDRFHAERSAGIDESRPVWVVTIIDDMWTDGGPGVKPKHFPGGSAIVDAVTGEVTDSCTGCLWLTESE